MNLPLCYKAGAAAAISQALRRRARRTRIANWWETIRYGLVWFVAGVLCAAAFFGAIALTRDEGDSELDPPPAEWMTRT